MEIASLVRTGSDVPRTAASNDLAGISGEDFMNILLKQLQYQDPFEPMSNQEMADQIATIRELEVNTRLGTRLEQITDQERMGAAAALIGKYARGSVSDGEGTTFAVEGVVTGVRFTQGGEVLLELDTGEILPMSGLEAVSVPDVEV